MDAPRVAGLKQGKKVGHGGCGRVYHATDGKGTDCAVKVFTPDTICRRLLEKMTARLGEGGWPDGVMPVFSADFTADLPFWIVPLIADVDGDSGTISPRNLQIALGEHPGPESWTLVMAIASALAGMHQRRVPHGNLKPGNVFLTETGGILLSDWTLGNMPDTRDFKFTDAVLYQPAEQLRKPSGYLDEAGYRWDTYSFGVLAYRLLTGRFPRCHDSFHHVAPAAGTERTDGIQADLLKIARNIESQRLITWPDGPRNELEAGFREWIDRCLQVEVSKRPTSMIEVWAGFEKLEEGLTFSGEREAMLDQRRRADRRSARGFFFAGVATASALVLGGLWYLSQEKREEEGRAAATELAMLRESVSDSLARQTQGEAQVAKAEQVLAYERNVGTVRLEASRLVGDRLFEWAMEKGNRRLPPLDGRELRLRNLERYFEDFLSRTGEIESLSDERARVRLQLAEVSIAAGNAAAAKQRLGEALDAWAELPMDAGMRLRVATDWLLLALLRQSESAPETGESFVAAREALGKVPETDVDGDRLSQLFAVLDFHEAKLLAAQGDTGKALEQLMRATQTLNRIADRRTDVAILRSELAACYLSSATILDGMGNLGDAREVRKLASEELVKLLKEKPGDPELRLDLAGCYAAMAESAVLSADISGAESISNEAMKLLDQLVVEQPGNIEAVSRKASQLGLRAGFKRDRGQATEAMKDYDEGIRMLESLSGTSSGHALVSFRLADLWWQKGRMLGMAGKRDEEIAHITKARDLLEQMETNPSANGPSPQQLQKTGAYLLGDLGHALEVADRKDDARVIFKDAVDLWEGLVASLPQSEEFTEGLAYCRHRLADLK